jgi:AraC-like DNA-binding protein
MIESHGRDGHLHLALSRADAAAALGMSLRHFQRHVQPHVRCVYSGQLRLFPVIELERWLHDQRWPGGSET